MARRTFLGDDHDAASDHAFSVANGFRFGFGFMLAGLVVALLVATVAWLAIIIFHIR